MPAPISSMFSDPVGAAQDTLAQLQQETEEQRRKRMQQQKMQQASGTNGAISGLFNNSGNQF